MMIEMNKTSICLKEDIRHDEKCKRLYQMTGLALSK